MLVILAVGPVAAPLEAGFRKKFVGEVVVINLVREVRIAVQIRFASRRFNDTFTVYDLGVRIVERVDINSEAEAVLGYARGMRDETEVETGRIVVTHRGFVVRIVFVYEMVFSIGYFAS